MDGNGRWAQARHHSRIFGHVRGASVARNIIEASAEMGLEHLSLFAFSTENWLRPKTEVEFLMKLLARRLRSETPTLIKNNVRFHCIGQIDRLPKSVQKIVSETIQRTANCSGMKLTFALSYGGRQEIAAAVRRISERVLTGELSPQSVDEATIGTHLESAFLPDPDLIIRTSGESRLSNFFLWQAAYSEIFFCPKPWPEFDVKELTSALAFYAGRERRFGRLPTTQPALSYE